MIPKKVNLKEERFILAYSFRGVCPRLLDLITVGFSEAGHHGRGEW
jgi:hypothetical protein